MESGAWAAAEVVRASPPIAPERAVTTAGTSSEPVGRMDCGLASMASAKGVYGSQNAKEPQKRLAESRRSCCSGSVLPGASHHEIAELN
jgi:hypothetical protein